MQTKLKGTLGILALDEINNAPPPPADTFNFPDWFPYRIVERKVPGAHPYKVVNGDLSLLDAYVDTARGLERDGVTAITADCGFTIRFQEALRNAVQIPVACSALLHLPLLQSMLPRGGRIGIMTYDSRRLDTDCLRLAGIDPAALPFAMIGFEGTKLWDNWVGPEVTTDWQDFDRTVLDGARRLLRDHPDITHVLLECAGFPRCAPRIRAESGLPVFDWVGLCNQMMEAAGSTA